MKKCIDAEVVFASGMTYAAATKVLDKAIALFGDRFYNYAIASGSVQNDWKAVAHIKDILQDFLADPEKYVVEID